MNFENDFNDGKRVFTKFIVSAPFNFTVLKRINNVNWNVLLKEVQGKKITPIFNKTLNLCDFSSNQAKSFFFNTMFGNFANKTQNVFDFRCPVEPVRLSR